LTCAVRERLYRTILRDILLQFLTVKLAFGQNCPMDSNRISCKNLGRPKISTVFYCIGSKAIFNLYSDIATSLQASLCRNLA
jgi:hypothetical protein